MNSRKSSNTIVNDNIKYIIEQCLLETFVIGVAEYR